MEANLVVSPDMRPVYTRPDDETTAGILQREVNHTHRIRRMLEDWSNDPSQDLMTDLCIRYDLDPADVAHRIVNDKEVKAVLDGILALKTDLTAVMVAEDIHNRLRESMNPNKDYEMPVPHLIQVGDFAMKTSKGHYERSGSAGGNQVQVNVQLPAQSYDPAHRKEIVVEVKEELEGLV